MPRSLLLLGLAAALWAAPTLPKGPPPTRTDNVEDTVGSVRIRDPYRWLENGRSPETRAWIAAQNAYTRALLDHVPGRDRLRQRLRTLLEAETTSLPLVRQGRTFFERRLAGQEQAGIWMRQDGRDTLLIDPGPLSPAHAISATLLDVSRDGQLLAYGLRRGGEDEITLRLFDLNRRKDLPDLFARARYFAVSLKPDRSGLYYSRYDAQGSRVYYHAAGTTAGVDAEIFGRGFSSDKAITSQLSQDGRYVLFTVEHGAAADVTELYLQDLAAGGDIQPIVTDLSARFQGEIAGDTLYVETNWQAPNGHILAVDLKRPARANWREVVPASREVIRGFQPAAGRLYVDFLENAASRLRVFDPHGKRLRELPLPAPGTVTGISGEWAGKEAFFAFSSFHIPPAVYRDQGDGPPRVWAQDRAPVESGRLELEQVWYNSKDGTRIPMFLLHPRGMKKDGTRPVLLTGYGGFNLSETPAFSPVAALWAELGGVFALPSLRGGGEFGETWHRAGMLEKKQNTFDDFLAAAEWLIHEGYTRSSRLAITGRSNGGLLVGAAITQRPDLFQAAVCGYPLLDMLRYQRFSIASFWVPEYGDPENPQQFPFLYAYSPYQHVKPGGKYPAVLFVTGDADTRVDPLHARKMTALLQASSESGKPILLDYDTEAGHSNGIPVSRQVDTLGDQLLFLLWQTGVYIH